MIYQTREGDTLDWILWHWYGREQVVPAVLEANPGLADLPPVLPAGVLINLPKIETPGAAPDGVELWD